jgi:drug/metabolite transporter (DMT)-like permease
MYAALNMAPVSMVAPVVATYPLITVLLSAVVLLEDVLTVRIVAGATVTVAGVVYLVASRTGV